jgi:hypothetical protein
MGGQTIIDDLNLNEALEVTKELSKLETSIEKNLVSEEEYRKKLLERQQKAQQQIIQKHYDPEVKPFKPQQQSEDISKINSDDNFFGEFIKIKSSNSDHNNSDLKAIKVSTNILPITLDDTKDVYKININNQIKPQPTKLTEHPNKVPKPYLDTNKLDINKLHTSIEPEKALHHAISKTILEISEEDSITNGNTDDISSQTISKEVDYDYKTDAPSKKIKLNINKIINCILVFIGLSGWATIIYFLVLKK